MSKNIKQAAAELQKAEGILRARGLSLASVKSGEGWRSRLPQAEVREVDECIKWAKHYKEEYEREPVDPFAGVEPISDEGSISLADEAGRNGNPLAVKAEGPSALSGGLALTPKVKAFNAYLAHGEKKNLSNGTDGDALAPESWEARFFQVLNQQGGIRPFASTLKIGTREHHVPVWNEATAGVVAEGAASLDAAVTPTDVSLVPSKINCEVYVTEELTMDSGPSLAGHVSTLAARAFHNVEGNLWLNGTGTGEPEGLFNGTTVTRVDGTGALGEEFTADDLIGLLYELPTEALAGDAEGLAYVMSRSVFKYARTLKGGTTGEYLLQHASSGPGFSINGVPVILTDDAPALSTTDGADQVLVGAFRQYAIADRTGISVTRLNDRLSTSGEYTHRFIKRVDGRILDASAFRILTA